jgi:hypothetical protein
MQEERTGTSLRQVEHIRGLKFLIVNFRSICSNITAAPAYGVYISQLIRYSGVCGSYQDFLDRGLLLTMKLLNQGFLLAKLKSPFRKIYGRHHDLTDCYRGNQNPYIEEQNTMAKWKITKGQTMIYKTYI